MCTATTLVKEGVQREVEFCMAFAKGVLGKKLMELGNASSERSAKDDISDAAFERVQSRLDDDEGQSPLKDQKEPAVAAGRCKRIGEVCETTMSSLSSWSKSRFEERADEVQELLLDALHVMQHCFGLCFHNIQARLGPAFTKCYECKFSELPAAGACETYTLHETAPIAFITGMAAYDEHVEVLLETYESQISSIKAVGEKLLAATCSKDCKAIQRFVIDLKNELKI